MTKKLLAFLMIGIGCVAGAQELQWQKSFGGSSHDVGSFIMQTGDGGYFISGSSSSTDGDITGNTGFVDIWLCKLDASGTIVWEKSYGGDFLDYGAQAIEMADGGFVVLAATNSTDGDVVGLHGGSDVWIMKIDDTGNLLWQKCYGGSGEEGDSDAKIKMTPDGGFIVTTHSSSISGDVSGHHGLVQNDDGWVFKIDAEGTLQWQKCYGGSGNDSFNDVLLTSDGGYLFCGLTGSNDGDVSGDHGNIDCWIVKTNANGDITWQKTMGGSSPEYHGFKSMVEAQSGYILTGLTTSNDGDVSGNHGASDAWAVKIDWSGNMVWQKCYGGTGSDACESIVKTNDTYVILCYTMSMNGDVIGAHSPGSADFWIIEINENAALLDSQAYGGTSFESPQHIANTTDGGCIAVGFASSNDGDVTQSYGMNDVWMLKFEANPLSRIPFTTNEIIVYPIPTDGILNFKNISNGLVHVTSIAIYNSLGDKVYINNHIEPVDSIDLSGQPNGTYFYALTDSTNKTTTGKIQLR